MKILFLMDSPEYLRFYDSAIEEMAARGHTVAMAVNSQRSTKPVGIEGLQALAGRVTVLGVVPGRDGFWAEVAHCVRATMDFVRFLHPTFAAAPTLRERIKRKVLPRALHWLDRIPKLEAGTVERIERGLMAVERTIPIDESITSFLRQQAPDVLLISPLVTAASEQVDWVRAARAARIRTAVCIASWDNLTNKGLIRVAPDAVLVWNEAQRREAVEYHYVPESVVHVTGAQLFDKWFEKVPARDRDAFCQRVGLPDSRPFVVFTGSSSFISESNTEVAFVRRWIDALRSSGDPTLKSINILVRPHPYNFHRWGSEPLAETPGVAVYPRSGYNPIDPENRNDFFDSLYHSAAVVGINTSAMVEAAIIGRPVCSFLAEEFKGSQEGTIHFRHLLPENGGFLRIAESIDEHVVQLREVLAHPDAAREETSRFVASFIRPHGVERRATTIFADAVDRLGAAPAPTAAATSVLAPLARPFVALLALPAVISRQLDRDLAGKTRKRVHKRIAKLRNRWRGYLGRAW